MSKTITRKEFEKLKEKIQIVETKLEKERNDKNEEEKKWLKALKFSVNYVLPIVAIVLSIVVFIDTKQKTDASRALAPVAVTYQINEEIAAETSVKNMFTNKKETISLYPLSIIVKSGSIVNSYSIVSYFTKDKEPIVTISPNTELQEKLASQHNDDIQISPQEVGSFWSDESKTSFYVSYLFVGADSTNNLVMYWYDEKQNKQGYLDNVRATATVEDNNTPELVKTQYKQLRNYFNENDIPVN